MTYGGREMKVHKTDLGFLNSGRKNPTSSTMRPRTASRLGGLKKNDFSTIERAFKQLNPGFLEPEAGHVGGPNIKQSIIKYCSLLSAFFKIKEFGKDDFVRLNDKGPIFNETIPPFGKKPIDEVYERFHGYNRDFKSLLDLLQSFVERALKYIKNNPNDKSGRIVISSQVLINDKDGTIRGFIDSAGRLFEASHSGNIKQDGTFEKNKILFIAMCLAKEMACQWTEGRKIEESAIEGLKYFEGSEEKIKNHPITHKPLAPASLVNFTRVKGEWAKAIAKGGGCVTQQHEDKSKPKREIAESGRIVLTNGQVAAIGFEGVYCYTKNGFTRVVEGKRVSIQELPKITMPGYEPVIVSGCNLVTILSANNGLILDDVQEDLVFAFQELERIALEFGMFENWKKRDENGINYNFFQTFLDKIPTDEENNDLITRENFTEALNEIKKRLTGRRLNKDISNRIDELEKKERRLKQQLEEKETKENEELKRLQKENEELKRLQKENEELKKNLKKIEAEKGVLCDSAQENVGEIAALKKQLDEESGNGKKAEEKVKKLQKELAELKKRLENEIKEEEEETESLLMLGERPANEEGKSNQNKELVDASTQATQSESKESKSESEGLKSESKESKSESEGLKSESKESKSKSEELEKLREELRKAQEQVKKLLRNQQSTNSGTQDGQSKDSDSPSFKKPYSVQSHTPNLPVPSHKKEAGSSSSTLNVDSSPTKMRRTQSYRSFEMGNKEGKNNGKTEGVDDGSFPRDFGEPKNDDGSGLNEMIEELRKEFEKLREEKEKAEEEKEKVEKQNKVLTTKNEEFETKVKDLEIRLEELQKDINR